jgi:hypothetical protein
MKKLYIISFLAASFLTSCSTSYQVLQTASTDVKATDKTYEHIGKDLNVSYNLWDGNGTIWFSLYNKTNNPLYIDLDRSHLIVNGSSVDYFVDEETVSSTSRTTRSNSPLSYPSLWTNQHMVTKKMKKIVEIPPHSQIAVGGRTILSQALNGCGIIKTGNGVSSTPTFTADNSPITFRNYVTYSKSYTINEPLIIDNSFYVEKILNVTSSAFKGKLNKVKNCPDEKLAQLVSEMPFRKAQNIYISVTK